MPEDRLQKVRELYDKEPSEIELIVKDFVRELNFYKSFYEHAKEYHSLPDVCCPEKK